MTEEKFELQFPLYYELNNINEIIRPMSETIDHIGEVAIFRFFKPKRIVEFGAATGNWCILMHLLSKENSDQHFILVEDFSWHNTNHSYNRQLATNHNFPKNKIELEKHISKHIKSYSIIDKSVDQFIESDLEEKVDIIRIDCDIKDVMQQNNVPFQQWDKVLEWIDRNGSDRLIILSDDIKSTAAPHRMFIMQQLVAQGKFKLMWIGEDTAAWCRTELSNEIQEWFKFVYSLKESSILDIDERSLLLHGYKQDYLHIRKNKIYNLDFF